MLKLVIPVAALIVVLALYQQSTKQRAQFERQAFQKVAVVSK